MAFSAAALGHGLQRLVPPGATGLVLALSGGLDSGCLVAALAGLRLTTPGLLPLRALHIDHGLQPAAAEFRAACAALCERFAVPLGILRIEIPAVAGESLEAAARTARYAALRAALASGECLVTAHHLDDQAETFVLQALRGAGLAGLAAMPACRRFGPGWHLRPLLRVPRRDLQAFAAREALLSCMDPMNADPRFDRVYLRDQVWPLLRARWPGASTTIARAAEHAADGQELLDGLADEDLARLRDGQGLAVTRLRRLTPRRQVNALRRWLDLSGLEPPPAARLNEALRQVLGAAADQLPAIVWGEAALRRYRDRVFLTAAVPAALAGPIVWDWQAAPVQDLGPGLGRLRVVEGSGGLDAARLAGPLVIRRRTGGERLRPAAGAATQSVQHLCQAAGLLPWWRDALPFIYAGEVLVAVAERWINADWRAPPDAPAVAFRWDDGPELS